MNRDGEVYYVPEGIRELKAYRFVYAKIDRAGKCISPKFAYRYFTKCGDGVLIYGVPETCLVEDNICPNAPAGGFAGNMLDNSTIISQPDDIDVFASAAGKDGRMLADKLTVAISAVSSYSSLKTGDIVGLVDSDGYNVSTGDIVSVFDRKIVIK